MSRFATSRLACSGLAILASLALQGCVRHTTPERRPLRIAIFGTPFSLDPHRQNEVLTTGVLRNLYEGLTGFNADMTLVPLLAESWDNPSDVVWRFHIRRGVHFHDGRTLTAKDVVFSLERARHPQTGAQNFGSYLVAVREVREVGPYTVEITTQQPYPILLNKLTFVLVVPAGSPENIEQAIGTGPYRLRSYHQGEHIAFEAFPQYWGAAPGEAQVELWPESNAAERLRLLLGGDIDIAQDPTPAEAATLRAGSGARILERDGLLVAFLQINPGQKPFNDLRVREAVSLALDREQIIERSLHGRGQPLGQMVGRNTFGYDAELRPPARDLARARELLSAAGYPRGFDVDLELRSGRDALEIRRQLGEAGIRVRLVERPWSEMFPRLLTRQVAFYFGALLDPSADASDFFDAVAHTRQPQTGYGDNNTNQYSNPQLDALIERSASTLDMRSRRETLTQAMRVVMADQVFVPVYSPSVLWAARDDLAWKPRLDGLAVVAEIRRSLSPKAGKTSP